MTPQQTRNRVLDAAVRLFNERGTAAVSTNHIAAEAGISPGNLYYHYRNKEEIVRELLERMFSAWDGAWWEASGSGQVDEFDSLMTMVRLNFRLLWEYRFFYREAVALMMRDPLLAERHAAMQQARLVDQEAFYRRFVDAGIMRQPSDPDAIRDLVRTGWILGINWLPFLEAGGEEVNEERMAEGERLILRVLRSYLTDEAATQLDALGRAR